MTGTNAANGAGCLGKKEFSYCFWAKLIVAIPAFPLIAILAASMFTDPIAQVFAAALAVALAAYLARWIDQLPALAQKVVRKKH